MADIDDLLEKTCKNMIKTILFCLEQATKGTIYRIGPMPTLQAVRVTSGIRRKGTDEIEWGLPSVSDYNPPGKSWEQYRDRPDHVLEAMGWCVEKQQSWTADNPYEDVRSVGKQLRGEIEDFYHMEPVLVRKTDLCGSCPDGLRYACDWRGNPIWQDSEYVVAAVIKIHFLPQTLTRDDRSTRIIKELSRSLGTELLSLHLRETLSRAQKEFARQRIQSCMILAHELRNTLVKFGFLFSAVNAEIGVLREEWEARLQSSFPELDWKGPLLDRLGELARSRLAQAGGESELAEICGALVEEQQELASMSLVPSQSEQWLKNKIKPKWRSILAASASSGADREEIEKLLDRLDRSLRLGASEELAGRMDGLPAELKDRWRRMAYIYFAADTLPALGDVLRLLEDPALPVLHRQQIARVIKSLKVLIELVPEVEERANRIILSLRNGALPDDMSGLGPDPRCVCGGGLSCGLHEGEQTILNAD